MAYFSLYVKGERIAGTYNSPGFLGVWMTGLGLYEHRTYAISIPGVPTISAMQMRHDLLASQLPANAWPRQLAALRSEGITENDPDTLWHTQRIAARAEGIPIGLLLAMSKPQGTTLSLTFIVPLGVPAERSLDLCKRAIRDGERHVAPN